MIVLYCILGLLGALILFMVVRTLVTRPRATQISTYQAPPVDRDKLVAELQGAVRIPTVTLEHNDEDGSVFFEYQNYLETTYPALLGSAQKINVNRYAVIYIVKGTDPALLPVAVLAHQDVGLDFLVAAVFAEHFADVFLLVSEVAAHIADLRIDFLSVDYSPADVLLTGDGHNYGFNLLVERRKGRLTGWIGYSYGRARRRYRGQETHGWRPAAHERPHELNAVATLKAGRRWSLGAALVVASGTPYTRVERFYVLGGNVLADYGPLYGERLPPYVRLDLSASYDFRLNGGRRSGINVSLCNATAHDNVLFYRLKVNESEYAYRPFSFALRVMPSVNYYFSF